MEPLRPYGGGEVKMAKIRNYEAAMVLRPDLDEEARELIIERIKSVITDNEGVINNIDEWGNRQLAYEINDYRSGYYLFIDFDGFTEILDKLEHNFRILGEILRSLITRREE